MPALPPTPTLPNTPSPVLSARQDRSTTIIIPTVYGHIDNSLHPGIIVGIVLGSVAGFLLLLFLIYTCLGFGPPVIPESEMTTRPKHKHSHSHKRRRGSARVTERVRVTTRESTRQSRGPPNGGEPIIVDAPGPSGPRGGGYDDEDDDDDEDEVVVIEENSPPRRNKKKRRSGGSVRRDREGGYRDVDPERFAGGDAPIREVRRDRRSRDY